MTYLDLLGFFVASSDFELMVMMRCEISPKYILIFYDM